MMAQAGWVLVVDDDAIDRLTLFRLLERAGHHATVADSGRAALELLEADSFDLVLLDLVMPDPDGYAVLEAMKGDSRLRHVPVIVLSGGDDPACVVPSIERGAVDYLDKPVDPVLLRARVAAALEKQRLREQEEQVRVVVRHLSYVAAGVARRDFDTEYLEPVARQADPLGELARAVKDVVSQLMAVRSQLAETRRSGPDGPASANRGQSEDR